MDYTMNDKKVKLTEEQIRDMVGAPTIKESQLCECGKTLTDCKDSYTHMTQGV